MIRIWKTTGNVTLKHRESKKNMENPMPQNMVSSKISPKMVNESIILEHPSLAEILTYSFPHFKFLPPKRIKRTSGTGAKLARGRMPQSGDASVGGFVSKKTRCQEFFIMGI